MSGKLTTRKTLKSQHSAKKMVLWVAGLAVLSGVGYAQDTKLIIPYEDTGASADKEQAVVAACLKDNVVDLKKNNLSKDLVGTIKDIGQVITTIQQLIKTAPDNEDVVESSKLIIEQAVDQEATRLKNIEESIISNEKTIPSKTELRVLDETVTQQLKPSQSVTELENTLNDIKKQFKAVNEELETMKQSIIDSYTQEVDDFLASPYLTQSVKEELSKYRNAISNAQEPEQYNPVIKQFNEKVDTYNECIEGIGKEGYTRTHTSTTDKTKTTTKTTKTATDGAVTGEPAATSAYIIEYEPQQLATGDESSSSSNSMITKTLEKQQGGSLFESRPVRPVTTGGATTVNTTTTTRTLSRQQSTASPAQDDLQRQLSQSMMTIHTKQGGLGDYTGQGEWDN